MGGKKQLQNPRPRPPRRCGTAALCCGGSRLSVSSSEDGRSSSTDQLNALSNYAHAMVQARLERMVEHVREDQPRSVWRRRGRSNSDGCVILIAMDRYSSDPRGDFRASIMEVITRKGLAEPKELRKLLNCYMSMNSREHRQAILEAFHEVCASLFL